MRHYTVYTLHAAIARKAICMNFNYNSILDQIAHALRGCGICDCFAWKRTQSQRLISS